MKFAIGLILSATCLAVVACTTAPRTQGSLSTYANLAEQKGVLAKRRAFSDPALLSASPSLYIAPVAFAVGLPGLTQDERVILTNVLSRSLCERIDDRIRIVGAPEPAALRISITITELRKTNVAAASASVVALRAPIGLGALGVEAEVLTSDERQAASMIWRRQADAVFTGARASSIGDAYNFAGQFGEAFGNELRRAVGDRRTDPTIKNQCQRFGSYRVTASLIEMISPIQLPPSWQERRSVAAPQ